MHIMCVAYNMYAYEYVQITMRSFIYVNILLALYTVANTCTCIYIQFVCMYVVTTVRVLYSHLYILLLMCLRHVY
jgi:hypothetical protein